MQDEELKFNRFDFVKLRNPEEIQGMIRMGYEYAERLDKAGALEPYTSCRPSAAPVSEAGSGQGQPSQSFGKLSAAPAGDTASVMDLHIYQL
jgi:hypothetical protein